MNEHAIRARGKSILKVIFFLYSNEQTVFRIYCTRSISNRRILSVTFRFSFFFYCVRKYYSRSRTNLIRAFKKTKQFPVPAITFDCMTTNKIETPENRFGSRLFPVVRQTTIIKSKNDDRWCANKIRNATGILRCFFFL